MVSAVSTMKSVGFGIGALVALAANPAYAQGSVTVLCGVQEEWCKAMAVAFEKKTGIGVAMTRKSAGEALAQIRAEAANPKIDIWWGSSGDPHLQAAEEGLSVAYDSPQMKDLQSWAQSQYKQSQGRSVGIYAGALGFVYNTEMLAKRGIQPPKCWADLLRPEFKGEVQMPNPSSSGAAYTALATLVQIFGEDAGFDYLKKLNESINQYTKSGAAPAAAVARGETLVGISWVNDSVIQKVNKFPVDISTPCEGTGYEIGSMSILKGAKNLESAKKFYDFALTPEAQDYGAVNFQMTPSNKQSVSPPDAPKFEDVRLIDYNFQKYGMVEERKRLLGRWESEIKSVAN